MTRRVQKAPDGGWGWVIVLVSFTFHLLMGFVYAMNVLYGAWLEEFDQGRGITSWVVAIFNTTQVFMGPLSASLGLKYGYKVVTFVGSVLMGVGFFLSFFGSSIIFLFINIGVIAGVGSGLCYVPVITMVAMYFNKKRSLAVGFATSGVGFGTFIMPPLMMMLEEIYTWRGVMFLLSGFLLQMCVLSLLLRPVPYVDEVEDSIESESEKDCLVDEHINPSVTDKACVANDEDLNDDLVLCTIETLEPEYMDSSENVSQSVKAAQVYREHLAMSPLVAPEKNSASLRNISTTIEPSPSATRRHPFSSNISISSEDTRPSTKKGNVVNQQEHPHINMATELLSRKHLLQNNLDRARSNSIGIPNPTSPSTITVPQNNPFCSAQELRRSQHLPKLLVPMDKSNPKTHEKSGSDLSLMLSGSLYNIVGLEPHLNSMLSLHSKASGHTYFTSNMTVNKTAAAATAASSFSQDLPVIDESDVTPAKDRWAALRVYCALMRNCTFVIIAISNLLISLSYLMPIIYMVDRAVKEGVPKSSASLALSLFGVGNLFSRISTGILADYRFVNRVNLYIICVFGCGACTSLSVFCGSSAAMHIVYGFCFGCFIGGYVILTPVVLVDFLGVELVGRSYGLCLVFMAVSMLIGTPMAGWIYDWTGSYNISFIVHGIYFILSSVILTPLAISAYRHKRKMRKDVMLETPMDLSS